MSVTNFIPEVWSALLIENLNEKKDITSLFNRSYEGEIRNMGDTVHVQKFDSITVRDYSTTGGAITYDPVSSTQVDILVNKNKIAAIEVEDVDNLQSNIDLTSPAIKDMADKIRVQQNQDVLADCVSGVTTANTIAAGAAIDLDDFAEARRLLSNADVPLENRWAIINPDMESDLLGNANIIQADQYGNSVPLLEGEIGRLMGFRVVVSTSLPLSGATPDQSQAVFMHQSACAFVQQKSFGVEALRSETRLSDKLRANVLYGTKLLDSNKLVVVERNA